MKFELDQPGIKQVSYKQLEDNQAERLEALEEYDRLAAAIDALHMQEIDLRQKLADNRTAQEKASIKLADVSCRILDARNFKRN